MNMAYLMIPVALLAVSLLKPRNKFAHKGDFGRS